MAWGTLGLHEVDAIIAQHVRASLLKLLVQTQGSATQQQVEMGLRYLIEQLDGLELAFDMSRKQQSLPLEPVNVAEVSDQVLHKLSTSVLLGNVNVLHAPRHKTPVLAHRASLARSLESMIYAVINTSTPNEQITLDVNASRYGAGVKLGVYCESLAFGAKEFRKIKDNIVKTSRPTATLSPSTIAHLYVADTLLGAMGGTFRTSIRGRKKGIATVLPFSEQLQLLVL